MRDEKVRCLPVLNKKDELVGIVSERDLLYASPSPVTSLSIHEIHYLVPKITVGKIMTSGRSLRPLLSHEHSTLR
jgi:acetoin utilization protein AcuB